MNKILPEIDPIACSGCGECLPACQAGALALVESKAILARPDLCEYDGNCEPACPTGAISLPYVVVWDARQAASQ
jgi:MinD superfamily P-loop ATPase